MSLKEVFRAYCLSIARNPLFQQLAPFAVLFILPIFILFGVQAARNHKSTLLWSAAMVLENLGLSAVLPWNWSGNGVHQASGSHERKKSKKKHVRTRAEQMSSNGHAGPGVCLRNTYRIVVDLLLSKQSLKRKVLTMDITLDLSIYQGHTVL